MRRIMVAVAGCLLAATACAVRGSLVQRTPDPPRLANPLAASDAAIRAGAKLYERECAACHGVSLAGHGRAPALNQAEVVNAPPATLFWILRNGSLRRGMPSFAHLPEAQRWQIIAFLQHPK